MAATALGWALLHHPFGPLWPSVVTLAYCVLLLWRPHAWLFLVPALLPVIDLTATTGAIYLTESDLLLAATLVMGYARSAWDGPGGDQPHRAAFGLSRFAGALLALLALSYAMSAARGFLPYMPFDQQLADYNNRWNSLRVAKGFYFGLALVPLLVRALREQGEAALTRFMAGLVAGLALICLVAVYERMAYPGLMNFASDYRITASFWEMHVGGAPLDGWLLLTLPFAIWAAFSTQRLHFLVPLVALVDIAAYVALVTFSRGVYGACLVGVLVALAMQFDRKLAFTDKARSAVGWLLLGAGALFWGMWATFRTGGYRALMAVVFLVAATHFATTLGRACGRVGLTSASIVLVLGAVLDLTLFAALTQGSLWAWGISALGFVAAAALWLKWSSPMAGGMALGAWGALAVAGALVTYQGGTAAALVVYAWVALALALVLVVKCVRHDSAWTWSPRSGTIVFGAAVLLALAVAVPDGYLMSERFSHTQGDFVTREQLWREAVSWLDSTSDWLIGKGVGRFPDSYHKRGPASNIPGTFSFPHDEANTFLRLSSASHPLTRGRLQRVVQAVSNDVVPQLLVSFDARVSRTATIYLEVCGRHLLYGEGCASHTVRLKPGNGGWQPVRVTLTSGAFERGHWYAPRRAYFAVALASGGRSADLDNIQLIDGSGADQLRNGDFSRAGDFWFFTSDHYYLPWHIENLFISLLFDQGILGLAVFIVLCLTAAVRVLRCAGYWPQAPYFLASLAGFVTVGSLNSLLDVPRLATIFYLVCFAMVVIRTERSARSRI
ncbi:hypothetical protein GALL_107430 [mine drainage metagenome]|uniref:O-antigen ligase n=1 Tax=mine drainage metagenome TaxID=410659 RepID=A0A1J5SFN7_9ZZZZ